MLNGYCRINDTCTACEYSAFTLGRPLLVDTVGLDKAWLIRLICAPNALLVPPWVKMCDGKPILLAEETGDFQLHSLQHLLSPLRPHRCDPTTIARFPNTRRLLVSPMRINCTCSSSFLPLSLIHHYHSHTVPPKLMVFEYQFYAIILLGKLCCYKPVQSNVPKEDTITCYNCGAVLKEKDIVLRLILTICEYTSLSSKALFPQPVPLCN